MKKQGKNKSQTPLNNHKQELTSNVIMLRPDALHPYKNNARIHSKKQIQQIANSIKKFGFTNPVLIDDQNTILAGHGRVEAAKLLGLKEVPTLRIDHLSDDEKRAYILADNKLALNAGWDKETLAIELQHLLVIDSEFDVSITGFEMPEIDLLLMDDEPPAEDQPPEPEAIAISKLGDMWKLGDHLVYCGDALQSESYKTLLGDDKAHMIFTDPPYNVKVDGHIGGLGKTKHREFAMASGEMSRNEFTSFLIQATKQLCAFSTNGSIHFVCMDWRHMSELLEAGEKSYTELKNMCVWNKDNGGMGSLYRSKHELVFVFKNGKAPHINNIELGKHGRYRTNVWDYAGANSMRKGRMDDLGMHPTVKPVGLVADAILDCSLANKIILDPFGGSGSTLMAAERVGRKARLIELAPLYVDVIIRRWQKETSQNAVNLNTGKEFAILEGEILQEEGVA